MSKTYKYTANYVIVGDDIYIINLDRSSVRFPRLVAQVGQELPDYATDIPRMIHNHIKHFVKYFDGVVGFDYIVRAKYDCDETLNLTTGLLEE